MSEIETLTREQVAELLHCTARTVQRKINAGELPATRVQRGLWIVRPEDLDSYLRQQQTSIPNAGEQAVPARPITPRSGRRRRSTPTGRLSLTDDMGKRAA